MRLTEHFSLEEFAISSDHPQLAWNIAFSPVEIERIRFACASILEPLRQNFGQPVIITSGKRTFELNEAVGGVPGSHHLFEDNHGAADFVVAGIPPEQVARWLHNHTWNRLVILYLDRKFLHLSFPDDSGIYNELIIKE
jgi:hypothetical protein